MHINIFGDRQARVPSGWVKETLVDIFGDSTPDASAQPGPGASLTVSASSAIRPFACHPGRA